jgi:translation initiation factor 1
MSKKKDPSSGKDEQPRLASPFAGLAGLREGLPPGEPPREPKPAREPSGPARAVVRMERKGRGGKEVTCIEKLGLAEPELARWCSELKKALGCGGTVEGDTIVLHGDLRQRLEPLLVARGVRKVTSG